MCRGRAKTESGLRRKKCLRLLGLPRAKCACPCSRHTDLKKHPQPNVAGSGQAQTRDLRSECSSKRSRTAIEFCRARFRGLESIRGSSREFQVWARCGRFQVWRTIALALPNSQMWSIQRPSALFQRVEVSSCWLHRLTRGLGSYAASDRLPAHFPRTLKMESSVTRDSGWNRI